MLLISGLILNLHNIEKFNNANTLILALKVGLIITSIIVNHHFYCLDLVLLILRFSLTTIYNYKIINTNTNIRVYAKYFLD